MSPTLAPSQNSTRLERLLGFLDRDPANLSLLGDAAGAAFDERQFDVAHDLLERYAALPAELLNLKGMLALATRQFEDAAEHFEQLRMEGNGQEGRQSWEVRHFLPQ